MDFKQSFIIRDYIKNYKNDLKIRNQFNWFNHLFFILIFIQSEFCLIPLSRFTYYLIFDPID